MTYDHWKSTNPADEYLGPEPDEPFDAELDSIARECARHERAPKGNAMGWRPWFAWRWVTIYKPILGQQTSLEPSPPGHRGRVVWLEWIERRKVGVVFPNGDVIGDWEYRERSDG
jgi:hypothetical protein